MKVLDAFVAKGVTPLAVGANDYLGAASPDRSLALANADADWVQTYQGLKAPLRRSPIWKGAEALQDWVKKGYVSATPSGPRRPWTWRPCSRPARR